MVANLKNRVVSQNLAEAGNPVVAESLAEIEPLRLKLLAMVAQFLPSPLSEIEVVFVVVEGLVEQNQFAKVVVVVGNLVAEHQAVLDGFVAAVVDAGSLVAEVAQIPVVDRLVEGERKVAGVEPLSVGLVDLAADLSQVVVAVFRPDTSKSHQSLVPSKCRPMPPEVVPSWQC